MYKYLFLLAGILFLVVPNHAQAGGGPVEFSVEPNHALNPGEQYVVHARVYTDGPYPTYCKNCYIKLALKMPQDGDYIAQDSETTNDEGRIYAKVISKVPGKRTMYVSELKNADGSWITANSFVVLNYKGDAPAADRSIAWSTQDVTLKADKLTITIDGKTYIAKDPKIEVRSDPADAPSYEYTTLEARWFENGVEMRMNLYFSYKPGQFWKLYEVRTYNGQTQGDWIYYTPINQQTGYSIQQSLGETYVANAAPLVLKSVPNSTYAGTITFENLQLKAFTNNPSTDSGGTTGISKPSVVTPTNATPSADQSTDTLKQKVSDLEEKLQKSEAKQSLLEQRISDLINFLKRLFPFLQ